MSDFHDYPRRYVGARYVPQFADPIKWDINRSYEALTIVDYGDNRYTSKIPVPVGVDIGNTVYWVLTGASNEKLDHYIVEAEGYREEVSEYKKAVDEYKEAVDDYHDEVGKYHDEVVNLTEVVNVNNTLVGEYKEMVDNYQNVAEGYRDDVDKYRQEVGEYKEDVEGYHDELNEFMSSIDEKLAELAGDFTWYDLKNELPIDDLGVKLKELMGKGYNAFILPAGNYTMNVWVGIPEYFALVGVGRPTCSFGTRGYFSNENPSTVLFRGINFDNLQTEYEAPFSLYNCKNSLFEYCNFTNSNATIYATDCNNLTIRKCGFGNLGSDVSSTTGARLEFSGNNITFENCIFTSNVGNVLHLNGYNLFFKNNVVRGGGYEPAKVSKSYALYLNGSNIWITNNNFGNVNSSCVLLTTPSYGVVIEGNYFGMCDCGVGVMKSGILNDAYATITNNIFSGIRSISSNKYRFAGDICVWDIDKSDNLVITGNTSRKGSDEGYVTEYLIYFDNEDIKVENTMISNNNVIGHSEGLTNYVNTEDNTNLISNNNVH